MPQAILPETTVLTIQDLLVKRGRNLGQSGPNRNGVDGDWGPATLAALLTELGGAAGGTGAPTAASPAPSGSGFSPSPTSLKRLDGVHDALRRVVLRAYEISTQAFVVQEGVRSLETQRKYVAQGVSKTLDSKHLIQADGFGHAVDLVPWINDQPRWEWPPIYKIAAAVNQAAREQRTRIRWGGVWDRALNDLPVDADALKREVEAYCVRHPGPDFLDGPHYELA